MFDLSGKRALITGGGSGIGLSLAEGLARAGASVTINGRNARKLEGARDALAAKGLTVAVAAFDVADPQAVAACTARLLRENGAFDILVNNAGTTVRGPLASITDDGWRQVMATNVDAAFYMARALVPAMIAKGSGRIINIASIMGEIARPTAAVYATSKGAIKMMTKAMAVEWGPAGIRVNGIGPGYFKTDMTEALAADPTFNAWLEKRTPLGRWGDVRELQGACVFLAAPASDFVTGHILYVDGGFTASY